MPELLQFLASGLTVGASYALVALGFALIYNASGVVNFAQGEFVMLGGMVTAFAVAFGLPLPAAAVLAVAVAMLVGFLLQRLCIAPLGHASPITFVICTIGASILIRGIAQTVFDKQFHRLPALGGDMPISFGGAAVLPQSFWVLGIGLAIVLVQELFIRRTLAGKAMRAVAANRLAAELVGIRPRRVAGQAFALAAGIGAIAGILITPITLTSYDVGTLLALKGFAAAVLGGMGSAAGAVAGGLLIGLIEALCAGYLSSAYKDASAFIVILAVLFVLPQGLFGRRGFERV